MTGTIMPKEWKCPGCGAFITLPQDFSSSEEPPTEKRLDQLAQALCGCWVVTIPQRSLSRLLAAVLGGREAQGSEGCRDVAGWSSRS